MIIFESLASAFLQMSGECQNEAQRGEAVRVSVTGFGLCGGRLWLADVPPRPADDVLLKRFTLW